jgi:hypothetical protein
MFHLDAWNQMLHQYVDAEGRVNYSAWKKESAERLADWLDSLAFTNPQALPDRDHQLAFWLNLYNALVIQQILSKYPIESIQQKILGVPNWLAFLWFFWKPVYSLGDRRYSLNQIEHKVLRSEFKDPRIHFALVCAAIGCPLLRNEAYFPETVQLQLEDDAKRFINNPDKVRYDAETQTLYCSKIFKWYRQDFLAAAPSILDYIRIYIRINDLASSNALSDSLPDSATVRYLDYDWGLNQRISL